MRKSIQLVVLLAAAALTGCGSSPKASFYSLSAGPAPATDEAKAPHTITIAIAPVSVPELVDRPQFVVRAGENQVTINEFERWAGPLRSEIPRVIADNLAQFIPGASVFVYPQSANVDAHVRVLIEVRRFESAPGDAVTVEVLWVVQTAKASARQSGRSVVREATDKAGYEAVAAAHSRALIAVSRDIAAVVRAAVGKP